MLDNLKGKKLVCSELMPKPVVERSLYWHDKILYISDINFSDLGG